MKKEALTNRPSDLTKHIRCELLLSEQHQIKLDALIAAHPTINTRVGLIRHLIDGAVLEQVKVIKQDPEFIRQLSALGNLINQFLKLAHTCSLYGEPLSSEVIIFKVELFNSKLSKLIKINLERHAA
ncbi:hypothetical protein [Shewanella sp. 125m-1]